MDTYYEDEVSTSRITILPPCPDCGGKGSLYDAYTGVSSPCFNCCEEAPRPLPKPDVYSELRSIIGYLGQDELRTLLVLARRLYVGQGRYGRINLATDRRDWFSERGEEIQDLLIYSAFAELTQASHDR